MKQARLYDDTVKGQMTREEGRKSSCFLFGFHSFIIQLILSIIVNYFFFLSGD